MRNIINLFDKVTVIDSAIPEYNKSGSVVNIRYIPTGDGYVVVADVLFPAEVLTMNIDKLQARPGDSK
jgi:hypothetical protein